MIQKRNSLQSYKKARTSIRFMFWSNGSPAVSAMRSVLPMNHSTRIQGSALPLSISAGHFGATMPFNRAAAYLLHLGIVIDRGTVRNYAQGSFPEIPTTDLFGIHLPLSIISLSDLTARSGEGSRIPGTEALAACGFPSAYRAAPDHPAAARTGG